MPQRRDLRCDSAYTPPVARTRCERQPGPSGPPWSTSCEWSGGRMAALLRYEARKSTESGREVVVLWLHQASRPVIVLDRALLESIDATLDRIAAEFPAIGGLVVTSDSRVFIAGADLKEIMAQDDPALHAYLEFGARVFGRLATMPCTTVAAI